MFKTTSDQVVQLLMDASVKRAYGVPGDAIDLILAAIHKQKEFDFFLTRHEEAAGFMASAHAKLTMVNNGSSCRGNHQDEAF